MNRLALIGLIGALLAPWEAWSAPAQVGTWKRGCQTGSTAGNLTPGTFACWSPTANEDASPIIEVSQCSSIDFLQYDDFDGDATVCTAVHRIEMCPSGADILTSNALKNAACAQLPGTTDLTGDDSEANYSGIRVRVRGTAVGANFSSCRVELKCVGPER